MSTTIQFDLMLTQKLWLPDEAAWRVSALNLPGAAATVLYAGGEQKGFKAEGDRVFWMGSKADVPTSATLHLTVPGDLHPHEDYEQQRIDLEKQKAVDGTKLQKVAIAVGVITAILGILGTLGAKAIGEPEHKPAGMTATDARECRQSLMRLQTLSTTAADADDIKKAVQREIPGCTQALEKVHQ